MFTGKTSNWAVLALILGVVVAFSLIQRHRRSEVLAEQAHLCRALERINSSSKEGQLLLLKSLSRIEELAKMMRRAEKGFGPVATNSHDVVAETPTHSDSAVKTDRQEAHAESSGVPPLQPEDILNVKEFSNLPLNLDGLNPVQLVGISVDEILADERLNPQQMKVSNNVRLKMFGVLLTVRHCLEETKTKMALQGLGGQQNGSRIDDSLDWVFDDGLSATMSAQEKVGVRAFFLKLMKHGASLSTDKVERAIAEYGLREAVSYLYR